MRLRSRLVFSICLFLATFTIQAIAQDRPSVSGDRRAAVTKVSPNAPVTTYAGNGVDGYSGDGGPAIRAELDLEGDGVDGPYGDMAFDSQGNLYFADSLEDGRIRRVDATTGIITTVAGGGTACTGFCGDGGPATDAHFGPLYSVTVDLSGNIYIAADSMILRVDASSGILTVVAGGYTCSTGIFGSSCRGNNGYTGDGGPATSATFYGISAVVVDEAGNLYVTDQTYTSSTVVREVAANTGIVTTIAGRGAGCAGQTDTIGDGCPATDAVFQFATGLALDAGGNLYISDTSLNEGGDRIRRIDASTGIISTVFAGGNGICSGASDNLGDGCPTTQAFLSPAGIALDSSGDIFIGEPGQCRVREVDTGGIIHLVAGINNGGVGSCGFSGLTASTAKFARAGSLSFDAIGNLYVSDDENDVIRKVGFGSTPTQIETTTTLTSNGNPQGRGANVIFTADVEPSSGTDTPTGTVTFTIDGAVVGAGTLDSSGHASYTTSTLIPNIHTIQVAYGGDANNAASVSSTLAETILTESAATPPAFLPAAGTYTSAQTVTISDSTTGAVIYYTIGSSTPTTSSTKYTEPITVSSTETINAIAAASGYTTSAVASATYTINQPPPPPPSFSPSPDTYSSVQSVTISDTTSGALIYYTTDGTTPTTSSIPYTAPIPVSSNETIQAIAAAAGVSSDPTSAAYKVTAPLQFVPVTPCRIADTRYPTGAFGGPEMAAGQSREFDIPKSSCGIPATAIAYSLNVTVVPGGNLGYLTLWPSGESQPYVSTLNSDGRVKANAAIIPAGINGGVSVFVTDPTQVVLDIDGYFVPAGTASALAFYPLTPCRVVDTEWPAGPLGGPSISAAGSRAFPVQSSSCGIPATAKAYSLNVTAIPHTTLDYLTAWPTAEAQPFVSTLNALTGAVVANAAIVPAGTNGEVSIFVSDAAEVILDINGYFAPPGTGGLSLYTVAPCRVIDTRPNVFSNTLTVNAEGSGCAPPSTAQAYVLNATVVPSGSLDYLTLWPNGEAQPFVSTLNALDGAITSNMAIVPTNNGKIDAYASNPTNLILDLSSYFAP